MTANLMVLPNAKVPDTWDNAKFEQIACAGLSSKYGRTPTNLIPMLNAIHIYCQNEVWYAATFIVQDSNRVDMVRNFSG
jgi:hypothetical protein